MASPRYDLSEISPGPRTLVHYIRGPEGAFQETPLFLWLKISPDKSMMDFYAPNVSVLPYSKQRILIIFLD
jgi:hypothetical protein